jgi:hypothetical protein
LTPCGIIIHSSNIGISKIAWELSGKELYDGFRAFGLAQKSGIDLSKELKGRIKAPYLLDYPTYSANSAINKMVQIRFIIFITPPVDSCCFVFNCNTKLDRVQQLIKAPKVQQ